MKIMKISVEPEIFLSLSGCSVEKAPNRHFTASLSGYVSEEEEKKILRHGIEEISILGILEDASQVVLFKGMIADAIPGADQIPDNPCGFLHRTFGSEKKEEGISGAESDIPANCG